MNEGTQQVVSHDTAPATPAPARQAKSPPATGSKVGAALTPPTLLLSCTDTTDPTQNVLLTFDEATYSYAWQIGGSANGSTLVDIDGVDGDDWGWTLTGSSGDFVNIEGSNDDDVMSVDAPGVHVECDSSQATIGGSLFDKLVAGASASHAQAQVFATCDGDASFTVRPALHGAGAIIENGPLAHEPVVLLVDSLEHDDDDDDVHYNGEGGVLASANRGILPIGSLTTSSSGPGGDEVLSLTFTDFGTPPAIWTGCTVTGDLRTASLLGE